MRAFRSEHRRPIERRQFLQVAGVSLAAIGLRAHGQEARPADKSTKKLKVHQASPFNAEPALEALAGNWVTPLESFYVRNHGKVIPTIEARDYRLSIDGMVDKPLSLSLAEIKEKFPQRKQHATLTCAGNRRNEHSATKMVSGVQWEAGAIGNAQWKGAVLWNALQAAGIKPEAKHIWFDGLDDVDHEGHAIKFGGSIPLEKLAIKDDAAPSLLVFEMNGAALLPEHGFPLRALVPGYIGARSVKWLSKITLSDRPSPNHFVADVYKLVQTSDLKEVAGKTPIYENVINGAITVLAQVKAGRVEITGYALPSGSTGSRIKTVEVSLDGGRNWQEAKLAAQATPYCWQLWSLTAELKPGKTSVIVRAGDTSGAKMPEKTAWNAKGYLYNGWQRVEVEGK